MNELTFREKDHIYMLDGERLPCVSDLCRFIHREIYKDAPLWQVEAAAMRGTAVHAATQDLDTTGRAEIAEEYLPYLLAYKTFLQDHSVSWELIEHALYHPTLRYAGTIDRYGQLDAAFALVDIKTTYTVYKPLSRAQLNLYRLMLIARGYPVEHMYILHLKMTSGVISVHVGGGELPAEAVGEYDAGTHTFTVNGGDPNYQGDVIFVCTTDDADLIAARDRFAAMPYQEYFNGATDSRIFFYGDGTNVCYYTGIPAFGFNYGYGDAIHSFGDSYGYDGLRTTPGLYLPAGNEIAVDFSDSPITAMVRHYSRLLVFKPDGTDAITYEPITLEDGSVVAGFYSRPVNREFGNTAPGQVVLVNNYPRSFTKGGIYEWRISSYSYRDERYAKCISQKVAKTIAAADPAKIVVCDDGANKTYYAFLNDEEGTVLVNRYDLDVWSIYKSELTRNVTQCLLLGGQLLFMNDSVVYCFDPECLYDKKFIDSKEEENIPIQAVWESGFMSFGADFKQKYSSHLWLSLLPQSASDLEVTVQTDKRSEYLTKTAGYSLLDFSCLDFSNFGFLNYAAPKIKRIQLKVKKFVYYKLILRVTKPGARATVLGYDQQVRYSSNVK